MNDQDVAMIELSRQDIYACLASCFQFPGQGSKGILENLERELTRLDSEARPHARLLLESFTSNSDLKGLQVDFAKLFVGPYTLLAPPYGSVYLESESRVMGETTMDVLQYYREAGLDVAATCKVPPDHIAAELEFMSYLINAEIRALAEGDDQCLLDILRLQIAFLNNHLNQWVRPFAQLIKSGTQSNFFVNLAGVTQTFVAEEAGHMLNLDLHQAIHP